MRIQTVCPHCRAEHGLPASLQGTRLRCPDCGKSYVLAPRRTVAPPEAELVEVDLVEAADDGIQTTPRRVPPPARAAADQPPRRQRTPPAQESSALALVLVFAGVAVGLVLLGGGSVAAWWLLRSKAAAPPPPMVNLPPPPPFAPPREVPPDPAPPPPNDRPQPAPPSPPRREPPPAEVGWKVQLDPAPEPVKLADAAQGSVPVAGVGDDVLFAAPPSPFVAVGRNSLPNDARQVWNLAAMKQTGTLAGKIDLHDPLALSPDGEYLAGAVPGQIDTVDVWTVATGKATRLQLGGAPGFLNLLDFAGPGRLVTGKFSARSVFQVWDVTTGKAEREIAGPPRFERESPALSPGRRYLAVASDEKLHVYDLKEGAAAGEVALPKPGQFGSLKCQGLAFAPDGTELAGLFLAGLRSRLLAWDLATGKVVADHAFPGDLKTSIKHAVHHGGRPLQWLGDRSGWLVYGQAVIDRQSGEAVAALVGDDPFPAPRQLLGPDHVALVAGAVNARALRVVPLPWDQIKAGRAAKHAAKALPPAKAADWSAVRTLPAPAGATEWRAAPDAAPAAAGQLLAQPVALHAKAADVRHLLLAAPATGQAAVLSLTQADGPLVSKQLRLDRYDLAAGKHLGTLDDFPRLADGPAALASSPAALSPDGGLVALADFQEPRRVDVWALAEGKHLAGWLPHEKDGNPGSVSWLAFLDGGRLLTAAPAGHVVLWDVPACRAVYRLPVPGPLALSPGGKFLAASNGETFDLFDAATGERRGRLAGLAGLDLKVLPAAAVAFRPDGKELAAAFNAADGGSAVVARWDLATGNLLGHFTPRPRVPLLTCSAPGKKEGTWSPLGGWSVRTLAWWGPGYLLVNHEDLVDPEQKHVVWTFRRTEPVRHGGGSVDDRHLLVAARTPGGPAYLSALPLPDAVAQAVAAATKADAALLKPGMTVSLRLDWNSDGPPSDAGGFRRKLTEGLTEWLKAQGIAVADGQTTVLGLRVAVADSDKQFEVREGFGPPGMPLPPFGPFPRMPRGPFGGGKPEQTFQGKRLAAQFLVWDGKDSWQRERVVEPGGGTVAKGDDPATFQLNQQWAGLSGWLAGEPLPYVVGKPPAPAVLPGTSLLTPDGAKALPGK